MASWLRRNYYFLVIWALASCVNDKADPKMIYGTWKTVSTTVVGCNDATLDEPVTSAIFIYPVTFSETGWSLVVPGYTMTLYPGCHQNCPPIVVPPLEISGTYSISGNTITIQFGDDRPGDSYTLALSQSTLTLSQEIQSTQTEGCGRAHNLQRVF